MAKQQFLFDRVYELTICSPSDTPDSIIMVPPLLANPSQKQSVDYTGSNLINATNVVITELQIVTNISKSTKNGSNKGATQLKIYNLSKNNRSIIERKGAYVVLKVGYKGQELQVVLSGQTTMVYTDKQGEDVVTTLFIKDAAVPQENQMICRTFPPKTKVKDIITTLSKDFSGISIGQLNIDDLGDREEEGGLAIVGKLSTQYHKYLSSYEYRYCIENAQIYVYPRTWQVLEKEEGIVGTMTPDKDSSHLPTLQKNALVITPENALSIRKNRDAAGKGQGAKDNEAGIEIKTLLDGRIKLKDLLISVKDVETDPTMNGLYSIDSITHDLTYEGGNWHTTVKGVKIRNV